VIIEYSKVPPKCSRRCVHRRKHAWLCRANSWSSLRRCKQKNRKPQCSSAEGCQRQRLFGCSRSEVNHFCESDCLSARWQAPRLSTKSFSDSSRSLFRTWRLRYNKTYMKIFFLLQVHWRNCVIRGRWDWPVKTMGGVDVLESMSATVTQSVSEKQRGPVGQSL
jgi:hypothetical protein